MTTISSYTTQSGVRYRVRYRKPDGSQTDKRGFKRKRDAEQWAAEHVATAKAQGSFPEKCGQNVGKTVYDMGVEPCRRIMTTARGGARQGA